MFRLSSSSTLGLWLSLLRRNTRTTFCTIFGRAPCQQHTLSYPTNTGSSLFTARALHRNPLCLHLASKPRLCCFGRGAPHIWNSCGRSAILSGVRGVLFSAGSVCELLPHLRCSSRPSLRSLHAVRLFFTIRHRVRALFKWVVMCCRGATPPPPSFPGYCMHNV